MRAYLEERRNHVSRRLSLRARLARSVAPMALLWSSAAFAQEGEQTPENDDEIVVTGIQQEFLADTASTATELNIPIIETPLSVTVLTEDFLRVTGARTIEDYANFVPNVDKFQDFGGSIAKYQSRGFRVSAFRGLQVNSVSIANATIDSFFTQRVEFVRGPTSIVDGNAGFGGVINTITKRPENDFAFEGALEAGSWDFFRGEADLNAPLSDSVGVRVVGSAETGGRFVRQVDHESWAIAPSLRFKLGENTSLLLTGAVQKSFNGASDQYTSFVDDDGALFLDYDLPRRAYIGAPWNNQDVDFNFAQARFEHLMPGGTRIRVNAGQSRTTINTEFAFAYGPADLSGDAVMYGYKADEKIKYQVIEASVGDEFEAFGQTQEFLVAGEYSKLRFDGDFFDSFGLGTINLFDPTTDFERPDFGEPFRDLTENEAFAAAAQGVVRPIEGLSLLLGARYEDGVTRDLSDGVDPADRETDYSKLVLRGGASIEYADNQYVYGSYSEGFEPNLGRLIEGGAAPPETGTQYEAGLKGRLAGGKLGYSAAYFDITRRNIAEESILDPQFVQLTGKQRHKGIEFELTGEPVKGLNIVASYGYLDAKIVEDTERPERVGSQAGNVPKHSGAVFLSYAPQEGPLAGFAFAGGVRFEGKRVVSSRNDDLKLPSFAVVSGSVLYRTGPFEFRLTVDNIFDEYYYEPVYDRVEYGLGHGKPRRVGLRVGYRF